MPTSTLSPITGRPYRNAGASTALALLVTRWKTDLTTAFNDTGHSGHLPARIVVDHVQALLRQIQDVTAATEQAGRQLTATGDCLRMGFPGADITPDWSMVDQLPTMIGHLRGLEDRVPALLWFYRQTVSACADGVQGTEPWPTDEV